MRGSIKYSRSCEQQAERYSHLLWRKWSRYIHVAFGNTGCQPKSLLQSSRKSEHRTLILMLKPILKPHSVFPSATQDRELLLSSWRGSTNSGMDRKEIIRKMFLSVRHIKEHRYQKINILTPIIKASSERRHWSSLGRGWKAIGSLGNVKRGQEESLLL